MLSLNDFNALMQKLFDYFDRTLLPKQTLAYYEFLKSFNPHKLECAIDEVLVSTAPTDRFPSVQKILEKLSSPKVSPQNREDDTCGVCHNGLVSVLCEEDKKYVACRCPCPLGDKHDSYGGKKVLLYQEGMKLAKRKIYEHSGNTNRG